MNGNYAGNTILSQELKMGHNHSTYLAKQKNCQHFVDLKQILKLIFFLYAISSLFTCKKHVAI